MAIHGKNLLTEVAVRNAKAKERTYRLRDGGGLWLVVEPTGRRWWKLRVVFAKKENSFSLGDYPEITLSAARDKRRAARKQKMEGIDPGMVRKVTKLSQQGEGTFEAVAREWYEKNRPGWSDSHARRTLRNLERDVFPWLGARSIGGGNIRPVDILSVLRRIESRSLETAHKVKIVCGQIFRYAIQNGRGGTDVTDPTQSMRGALDPIHNKRMAHPQTPEAKAKLLRAIDGYKGTFIVKCALQLAPMLFVRPVTLAEMEWVDVDLDKAEWRIPVERSGTKKCKRLKEIQRGEIVHIVPLSRQAVAILRDLHPLTGNGRYAFSGARNREKPISPESIRKALRIMGFSKEDITTHGFRHVASTALNETELFPEKIIEKQLAHATGGKTELIYNAAEYLPARHKMMQYYCDYLDRLKAGEADKIVPILTACS